MLSAIGAWLASYAGGLVVKLIVDGLSAWMAQNQSIQNARDAGAASTAAKTNQATVETQDEMDNIPRPSNDDVAGRLRSGKF
jgi:3-mercaptopyruvate sulfurtransferase SseA